jgi:hypothetical protein
MKAEMEVKVKYGVWGLICGAVIAMIIGFAWGGWTTSSTSQTKSDAAVLASQAAICVAQVVKDPSKLKEFEGIESSKRYEFIEKGGWDKMPGQKEASNGVRNACVEGLEVLIKK